MGSFGVVESSKPHAVCIPYPAQGHINPMLKFAKLLHHRGFHITFVNTEYNHRRLLKSRGPDSLNGLPDFQFEKLPDGLPPSDNEDNITQDIPALCESTTNTCLSPFRDLIHKLNKNTSNPHLPPVTCIVSDGVMSFTLQAAEELRIPEVLFWTTSACGFMGYLQYPNLIRTGLTPLKDESYLTNGYLETSIDWIPGMKDIRLKDLPGFIWTTDPNEFMTRFVIQEVERASKASAIVLNTFDALEGEVVEAIPSILKPPVYTVGSLHLLLRHISDKKLLSIGSNLWKEERECLEWLDSKEPNSVVYNSKHSFLWVIRPDLVAGDSAILPPEFVTETEGRSMLASWCPQEHVLNHPSIAGFLTHSGWNSTIESISSGIPMICWPFFAEQQTNCRYSCTQWEIGMEIDNNVKRDEVEILVRELMEGGKGKEMKNKAMEWKKRAEEATAPGGTSYCNVAKLVSDVLITKKSLN